MKRWWRLVRFGFRLLYNEFAFTYDWVSWLVSLGEWRCWVRAPLKDLVGQQPVLELAHGTGNLQTDLLSGGWRAIGCDLSPAMGRIAQGKLRRNGLPIRLTQGRTQALPFAAQTFAAVVSTFPTDFIAAPETLREVWRVLQPDGVFVIVPNARLLGGGLAERGIDWLYRVTGQRGETLPDERLTTLFAPFAVEVRLERCPRSEVTVIIARKTLWNSPNSML